MELAGVGNTQMAVLVVAGAPKDLSNLVPEEVLKDTASATMLFCIIFVVNIAQGIGNKCMKDVICAKLQIHNMLEGHKCIRNFLVITSEMCLMVKVCV